jgi:hypothetical protein
MRKKNILIGFQPELLSLIDNASAKRKMKRTKYITYYLIKSVKKDLTKKELGGSVDIELY